MHLIAQLPKVFVHSSYSKWPCSSLIASVSSLLYALRVLTSHGLYI